MPLKKCVVIQHVLFEDLGTFAGVLMDAGFDIFFYQAGVALPEPKEFLDADLSVVLGGPIGAMDDGLYPFLTDELRLVEGRLREDRALMGICLGAQLMARALGAGVYPGREKEIGFSPLTLTPEGEESPLRHLSGADVLHWHGDTYDLPDGAELLASTPITPNQAFQRGKAIALQFHPEADSSRIEQWLVGHACELGTAGIDPRKLRADALKFGGALKRQGALMLKGWLGSGVL